MLMDYDNVADILLEAIERIIGPSSKGVSKAGPGVL